MLETVKSNFPASLGMAIMLHFSQREMEGWWGGKRSQRREMDRGSLTARLMSFSAFCMGQAMHSNLVTDIHYLFTSCMTRTIQSINPKNTIRYLQCGSKLVLVLQCLGTSNCDTLHVSGSFSCKLRDVHFQTVYLGRILILILVSGAAVLYRARQQSSYRSLYSCSI